jgi:ketosteroid isomerase-like protein
VTPAEFIREYEASGREHGLEYTLSLIDDNAVYWFSDGSSHVGKNAIEQAIRRNFEAIKDEVYRIRDVVWVAESTDIVVCIYRFEWSGIHRGIAASGSGRGTSVLARRDDSWVVVHEHLSKGETDD